MKKLIIIFSVIVFICSTMFIPPPVRADSSGAAQGALIGALIGGAIGMIFYIISVSSETPMDKAKSETGNNPSDISTGKISVFDDSLKVVPVQKKQNVISYFPLAVAF